MGDPSSPGVSSPVVELRDKQRRLREAVEAFEAAPAGSADHTRLFVEVNALVGEVVTARHDIPLRQHQRQHDRYDLSVRVLGGVVALAAVALVVGAVAHWVSGWWALLALALLVVGARSVLTGAGERDRLRSGDTPGGRLFGVIAGMVGAVSTFVAAFVTWWVLSAALIATVVAVAEVFWSTAHAAVATAQTTQGKTAQGKTAQGKATR